MIRKIQIPVLLLLLLSGGSNILAQQDTIRLHLRPNVTHDHIQLRWVAGTSASWYFTNKNGVIIERYTILRDGNVLATPEKTILTPTPLKPPRLDDWKEIVEGNPNAAIIAQALYGTDFEVSGGQSGIGAMIALSQEQEQRYAMAMYAADMSYPAAKFAGWGYEDKTAVKGET